MANGSYIHACTVGRGIWKLEQEGSQAVLRQRALEEIDVEVSLVGTKSQLGCIQFYLGRSIRFQLTHEHTSPLTFPHCSIQDLSGIVLEFSVLNHLNFRHNAEVVFSALDPVPSRGCVDELIYCKENACIYQLWISSVI